MSKAQTTPGPWIATNDRRGVFEIIHDGDMLAQVWRVRPGCDGDLPAEANARLIAAAPELLAACKLARGKLHAVNCTCSGCREIDAAIAKAQESP